ncbi:hypothetical protein ACLEEB_04440, partial [Lonsdalea quercina]|uniref:hypothetical protein n=1 Tax=Lonsdalea quercina TaxID=71657 RepID=UPI003975CBAA
MRCAWTQTTASIQVIELSSYHGAECRISHCAVTVASGKKERDNVASMTGLQFTVTIGALPESTFS